MHTPKADMRDPLRGMRKLALSLLPLVALLAVTACKENQPAAQEITPLTQESTPVPATELASAAATPVPVSHTATVAAPPPCYTCGTVTKIVKKKKRGKSTGLGIVTGALVGGVAGHNIGHGDSATAAGAIVGGIAGHEIEKTARSKYYYRVTVRMQNGDYRKLKVNDNEGLYVGRKVRVEGGDIVLR